MACVGSSGCSGREGEGWEKKEGLRDMERVRGLVVVSWEEGSGVYLVVGVWGGEVQEVPPLC